MIVAGRAAPGAGAGRRAAAGRRRGSTPTPRSARTRSASPSSGSTSTRRPSASCATQHGGDGDAVRAEVLEIIASRGKMHNPVTGSGGMLIGTVAEVGPDSPLGPRAAATGSPRWSRSRSPRWRITDGLAGWDGRGEQVPCAGHAILFGRSIAAVLPDDLDADAGAGRARRVRRARADRPGGPRSTPTATVGRAVLGGGRQVGLAVAGRGAPGRAPRAPSASCPTEAEATG